MINQTNQTNQNLQIGDKIGFVRLAQDVDSNDSVMFFPVVEITERDGEAAYFYQYPDGEVCRTPIKESWLEGHPLQLLPRTAQGLCLRDRVAELKAALLRGLDDKLQVFDNAVWDSFTVKNPIKGTQYIVNLDTRDGQPYAKCTCPDFKYRKHLCKHIAEVLVDKHFGVTESEGVILNA